MTTIKYPKRIALAQTPTPLEFMPRLTEYFGGPKIYFKRDDLTGSTLSGNKVRKIEFSLAEALARKADVIITVGGIQSNHCRATALACARLGLGCHLILRGAGEGPPDGNLLLDYLAGASFSFFPREVYSTQRPKIVADLTEQYARQGKKAYYIPVGASNAVGSWGYVRAYSEIMSQAEKSGLKINHIVTATGSGGTNAGLIVGRALHGHKKPEVWGVNVCDDEETFIKDISVVLEEMKSKYGLRWKDSAAPIHTLDGYVGEGYAIPYPEVMDLIAWCGRNEGQIFDPVYTGKALYGLGQEIRKGRFTKRDTVVFIHTGGIYGLFPQRAEFRFPEGKGK
ncbi:MAG: D-cysteine desulfhydrase family protein [Candidatus Sumerlaeaceae bacterium]|nr:D-cysteine desulfhydrase family protein [Candidatus Sumerlaeaceae bacterium]